MKNITTASATIEIAIPKSFLNKLTPIYSGNIVELSIASARST
ncbi:MAG: hypothetical protein ACRBEQ_09050 [Hyphomonas sp.]